MDINFAPSFFKSLKNLKDREKWYFKTWEFIRYDLPRFFKNIWLFRSALYNHRWYSGHHTVFNFMEICISDIAENVDAKGNEERKSAIKKIEKMRRSVEILSHFRKEDFIELAEKELNMEIIDNGWEFEETGRGDGSVYLVDNLTEEEKLHNKKIYDRSNEIEENMFSELWKILEGQDYRKFEKAPDGMDHNKLHDHWLSQFDGSGIRGWWD